MGRWSLIFAVGLLIAGCRFGGEQPPVADDATVRDVGSRDSGTIDATPGDAEPRDAGSSDVGPRDSGPRDSGPRDSGPRDAGPRDSGPRDSGPRDAGPRDAGPRDAGFHDAGGTPDAGTADAGFVDAGTARDGGPSPDAGPPFDAGPQFDIGACLGVGSFTCGAHGWNGECLSPAESIAISPDGRRVAFIATDLIRPWDDGPFPPQYVLAVRDLVSDVMYVLPPDLTTRNVTGDFSYDGRYFFYTDETGYLSRFDFVARSETGIGPATVGESVAASWDGAVVAYTDSVGDVRRWRAGTTQLVAQGPAGGVSMSPDARFISFISDATTLVPGDVNGYADTFRYDHVTQSMLRVGGAGNGDAVHRTAVSPDGSMVAFASYASNLVPNDIDNLPNVFVTNVRQATNVRVPDDLGTPLVAFSFWNIGKYVFTANGRHLFVGGLPFSSATLWTIGASTSARFGRDGGVGITADGSVVFSGLTAGEAVLTRTSIANNVPPPGGCTHQSSGPFDRWVLKGAPQPSYLEPAVVATSTTQAYVSSSLGVGTYPTCGVAYAAGVWTRTNVSPCGLRGHSAVVAGSQVFTFGGGGTPTTTFDVFPTGTVTVPPWVAPRARHRATWTGTEMIVFGGADTFPMTNGVRYAPATNSWTATATTGEPSARFDHVQVWTGTELLVYGGAPGDSGGRYDPTADAWSPIATGGPGGAVGVWTGTELLVFGAWLGRYDPTNDRWTTGATSGFIGNANTAVWTGTFAIVMNNGAAAAYDPTTNTWTAIPLGPYPGPANAAPRTAAWVDGHVIAAGGGQTTWLGPAR